MGMVRRGLVLVAGVGMMGGSAGASDVSASPPSLAVRVDTRLTGIRPLPGSRLVGGTTVPFSATVGYDAHEGKGTVRIIVQDQHGRPVMPPRPLRVMTPAGRVTVRLMIPVPRDATALTIFTPVMFGGRPSQGSIGHVTYPVVPGPAPTTQ